MSSRSQNTNYFSVELKSFDGPIDLLLHLVKKNELEISKLSLAKVCAQYFDYINEVEFIDLDLASEYLVIAATLTSIKSSLVLNKPVELVEDEEGNLVDPHEELLRLLQEAEIYKDAARDLGKMPLLNEQVYAPKNNLSKYESVDRGLAEHDSFLLVKALQKALKRLDDLKTYDIVLESVSIVERMSYVMDCFSLSQAPRDFYQILKAQESKSMVIGTFLAVLELCKRQVLSVQIDETKQSVMISLSGEMTTQEMTSEYDIVEDQDLKAAV